MEKKKAKFPWYWVLPVIFLVAGSWGNFNLFLFNLQPHWTNIALSLGYLLFWFVYPFVFRGPYSRNLFLAAGLGTMTAAALALPIVFDVFWSTPSFAVTLPFVILFSIPLTGLSIFVLQDYRLCWILLLVFGGLWTLIALFLKFRRKYT